MFERLEARQLLTLTHQYTFNDGTAKDSVAHADGALLHGATVVDGWLTLQNISVDTATGAITNITSGAATAQFAQLPAGILPSSGSATIEVWYTSSSAMPSWMRVFDFGDQLSGAGNSYLYYTPRSASNDARAVLRPAGGAERVAALAAGTFDGLSHMAAIVVDSSAALLRLYVDGNLITSTALGGAGLGSVSPSLAFFGRSLFDVDPAFNGGIDEVRIYNDAQSAAAISAHAAQGATRAAPVLPARQVENLDRGVVAFNRSNSQVYLSWRLLTTDPPDIAFNVYRSTGGAAALKRNSTPLTKTTDFTDTGVTQSATNEYFVRSVVNGVETAESKHFIITANTAVNQYLNIPLNAPPGGTTPDGIAYTYNANDASVGDLDGDGQYEIVLKWDSSLSKDSSQDGFTGNTYFDAYRLDGTFMWRIDLGQNIRAGAHYTQFMVYDLDGDGKAEIAMKTAPGTIDGLGHPVLMGSDKVTDDYRNATTGRINSGPEYLTVFNGQTGGALATVAFKPDRINTSSWGDDYGNRQDRILMSIAYLDGARPSLVVGRGLFPGQSSGHAVRNELTAWNFRNGQITMLWWFRADQNTSAYGLPNINTTYVGQGNYEMQPADVDGDGKDEIVYGSMTVNDNGQPLYSTQLGHGDALYVTDMNQADPGEEIYMPMESPGSNGHITVNVHDGATGSLIFTTLTRTGDADPDVGRGNAFDIDPRYPGFELWDSYNASIYNIGGATIQGKPSNMFQNFGIQWDADPLYELLDGTTIGDWRITNGVGGRTNYIFAPSGLASNNGTKSTPCLVADLFGDWRDEVIWRTADNTALQIWSTVIPANSRMVTPMDDIQYRESVAWQNVGYNQPPHPSFYMGDGMRTVPQANVYFAGGPSNVALSPASVAENQPVGTVVGSFNSTASGAPSTYTYSFVTGTGSIDNGSFQIVGNQLKTSASFDFETKSSYTIRVRTTDANGLFFDKQLTVSVANVNEAPTISSPATASPNPTAGTTSLLSVLGDDDAGEANVVYSWKATNVPAGATTPTFTASGTNAAKNSTATFYKAGVYTLQVMLTDSGTLTTSSSVSVTVNQTLTTIGIAPASAELKNGQSQLFGATALDQFGNPLAVQPNIVWTLDGGSIGSIDAAGNYTAPLATSGGATVRATSGSSSGTAAVNVTFVRGDFTLDGVLNPSDMTEMLVALVDLMGYQSSHNLTNSQLLAIGDLNADGAVSNRDIQPMLDLLGSAGVGGGPPNNSTSVAIGPAAQTQSATFIALENSAGVGMPANDGRQSNQSQFIASGSIGGSVLLHRSSPAVIDFLLSRFPTALQRRGRRTELYSDGAQDPLLDGSWQDVTAALGFHNRPAESHNWRAASP